MKDKVNLVTGGSRGFLGWPRQADGLDPERYKALESFMLVAVVAHCGTFLARTDSLGDWAREGLFPAALVSAILGLASVRARPYCIAASLGVVSLWVALTWPSFANHALLEISILFLLLLCRGDEALAMNGARWLTALVLFHSGFQKLVLGHYFNGELLGAMTAQYEKFNFFFRHFLSAGELARLEGMHGRIHTGPYSISEPLFVLMSNAVWIGEMGIAIALMIPRTRKIGVWGGLALVVGIELGAREIIFGSLFAFLILMFLEGQRVRFIWPVLALMQILGVLAYQLRPEWGLN